MNIEAFFDIETSDWDAYVLGGIRFADGHYKSFREPSDLFVELLSIQGEVWSWNGGLYDAIWFVDMARENRVKLQISTAGTRITRVQAGKLVLRDAVALVPMSLAKAASIAKIEVVKDTGLPCICQDDCGGYCSIDPEMSDFDFERLDKYLRQDCEAGFKIMEAVFAEAMRCDYQLTGTVGGSAWKSASVIADIEPEPWTSSHYQLARAGYYGGRTEVFQPCAQAGFAYDINSAYPAALEQTALPVGNRYALGPEDATKAFSNGKEGIFICSVKVPKDVFIPPLPARLESGRVCYPVGSFSGSWTALELREAARSGADLSFHAALVWADSKKVLAPFMRHVWERRAEAKASGNEGLYKWHKWFANSLTGKLAESPDKDRVLLWPEANKIKACPGGNCRGRCSEKRCCDHQCSRRCGAWLPIDRDGALWTAPFWRISDCGLVHWAAYLTASARVSLRRQLIADGEEGKSAVYCDTDSCYATTERHENIGPDLGQWGFDGQWTEFVCAAPKAYCYTKPDGSRHVRAKGLSGITYDDFRRFLAGDTVIRERGVMGLRSAARSKEAESWFTRKYLARKSHADGIHFGSRILREDGKTYPQEISEVIQWEKMQKHERK